MFVSGREGTDITPTNCSLFLDSCTHFRHPPHRTAVSDELSHAAFQPFKGCKQHVPSSNLTLDGKFMGKGLRESRVGLLPKYR